MKFSPRAVIFDWDNTLIDSWGTIGEAVNHVRGKFGLQTWNRKEILENCNRSARDSFPDWFGKNWKEAYNEFYRVFNEARARRGIIPIPGVVELLSALNKAKIPVMVVSNKRGDHLREEAKTLGWSEFFTAIVGAGDAARDKPDKEHALHALRMSGFDKGSPDILFIGDGETDIVCARAAGCTPLYLGTEEMAKKLNVKMFAADCIEVMNLITI